MDNARWTDIKAAHPPPSNTQRTQIQRDLDRGQHIYDLRTKAGLTQSQLAKRAGTTSAVIQRLEEGGSASAATITRIAQVLDMPST